MCAQFIYMFTAYAVAIPCMCEQFDSLSIAYITTILCMCAQFIYMFTAYAAAIPCMCELFHSSSMTYITTIPCSANSSIPRPC